MNLRLTPHFVSHGKQKKAFGKGNRRCASRALNVPLSFYLQEAQPAMVKFSSQVNSLVLALIALQVVRNEARKIMPTASDEKTSSLSSSAGAGSLKDEQALLISDTKFEQNSPSLPTELEAREQDTRGTKYSYFYVGRWTWHIPLWFTLWFSFYVFWNVIRAILGHKVRSVSS